jgi:hypothetical protein
VSARAASGPARSSRPPRHLLWPKARHLGPWKRDAGRRQLAGRTRGDRPLLRRDPCRQPAVPVGVDSPGSGHGPRGGGRHHRAGHAGLGQHRRAPVGRRRQLRRLW